MQVMFRAAGELPILQFFFWEKSFQKLWEFITPGKQVTWEWLGLDF